MISVIMGVFNESESEIKSSVNSILLQTYKDFELIIINDNPASEDIKRILNDIGGLDYRIRIIHNDENIGLALSMNKAAQIARGEYIARMDADDISETNRFAIELNAIKEYDVDFVFSNFTLIDDCSEVLNKGIPVQSQINQYNLLQEIVFRSCIHHPTVMLKKSVFDKVGGYRNFPCAQDKDLWLRLVDIGCRFYWIENSLLKYRIRENSISRRKELLQYVTLDYIMRLFVERIRNNGFDSYSIENYNVFIKSCRIDSWYTIETFKVAQKLLTEAKNRFILLSSIYRLITFFVSYIHRRYFLFRLFNKKVICSYLNKL